MSLVFVDKTFVYPVDATRGCQACRVARRNNGQWSYMWSDDLEALHSMASRIGMRRHWFQNSPGFPHYDLTPSRRALAINLGAVEKSLLDWIRETKTLNQPPAQPLSPAR